MAGCGCGGARSPALPMGNGRGALMSLFYADPVRVCRLSGMCSSRAGKESELWLLKAEVCNHGCLLGACRFSVSKKLLKRFVNSLSSLAHVMMCVSRRRARRRAGHGAAWACQTTVLTWVRCTRLLQGAEAVSQYAENALRRFGPVFSALTCSRSQLLVCILQYKFAHNFAFVPEHERAQICNETISALYSHAHAANCTMPIPLTTTSD